MPSKINKFNIITCLFLCFIYFVIFKYANKVSLKFFKPNKIRKVIDIMKKKNNLYDILLPGNFTLWKPRNFNLKCSKILNGDINYINKIKEKRFTMKVVPKSYKYDCESIKSRGFYSKVPLSDIEANYPIAYARNVYNNYHMLELEFLVSYAPQNHYCFSVDLKSTELYKQLTSLAKCFDNVYVPSKRYLMNSNGIYQALSTYECMKILINKKWNYLFILQNDDFPIKTNREIVEILKARNSTLDMEFRDPSPFIQDRINQNASWDYKSLNFFNETEISKYDEILLSENIKFSKGSYASGVPRDSVDFIVNKINITKYLYQINTVNKYGEDEMVWQTLFSDNLLKIPHYVDRNCLSTTYNEVIFMVRNVIWEDRECKTEIRHHFACVYGIEMLSDVKNMKSIFGYRFIPEHDFGAALCLTEYLFNKTYLKKFEKIDTDFYVNLPSTKYQNANLQNKYEIIEECNFYKEW